MPRSISSAERLRATALFVLALALGGCATGGAGKSEDARVACAAGPIAIEFGALPWLAFACDDGRSIALVSAPGNPAAPFSFVVRPGEHGVRVQGDGTGDRGATAAAFAELMALDDAALGALYTRTLMAPAADPP